MADQTETPTLIEQRAHLANPHRPAPWERLVMTGPNPNGCHWCGIDERGHAIQYGADGSHTW